ncbi:hypothetical protein K450DRAFT_192959 [Umbelopsis ramanniana AG]|uniref:L domain-like protein n=1 Tax=Umbelopsis ramanniana AG TaxID=1314678 RepID=A0AAD5E2A0_UMBRA|nr:uncharacterized protein K450DRAFT_192959 [Umbelopsis ramanniana AG]KAI8576253.1 hypothetical protein K450DRAFT_192959 [Umbelopsis ramanniana AG]
MSFLARFVRQAPNADGKSEVFAFANLSGSEPSHVQNSPTSQRPDRLRESPEHYQLCNNNLPPHKLDKVNHRNSLVRRSDSGYQSMCDDINENQCDTLSQELQYIDETYYPSLRLWDQEATDINFDTLDTDTMNEQQEIDDQQKKFGWTKVSFRDVEIEVSRYGAIQRIGAVDRSIVRLSPNISSLWPALTQIHLSNNLLEKLPASLACLRNLTNLELSGNRLTELPDNIGRLTRLTVLNVSNNMITHLPDSMGSLRKLTVLLLNDNQLSDLPKSLGDLKLLTTLDISRNPVRIVPAELARLQYLRYIRVDGCPMVLEYAPEPKHSPPSLLELAARTIVRNDIEVPNHVRDDIKEYVSSANKCTHCGGPFFTSYVQRVKLVEKADQTMIPMEYNLCSAHWNDDKGRIMAMFASRPATSKKPAHVLRAEKATRSTSSEQQFDLRSPRQGNQPRRRNTTSETLRRTPTPLASPIPASPIPSSMMSDITDVPERTASPASMMSNSATISISSLARKMYTSSPSSMSQMDTVLSASSSGSSTPEIAPATLPTRWRTQKVRNRSNTGFLSLSKLQRATSFSSTPSSQGIAI